MLNQLKECRSLILVAALLPFIQNYREGFQDWLYDRRGPNITYNNYDAINNSSPLVSPARIEHLHGDVYRVTFDSDGDGTLDEETTGILHGRKPSSLDSQLD